MKVKFLCAPFSHTDTMLTNVPPPDPGNSGHTPLNDSQNSNNTSPTPSQIWFAQNVYPLVTPKRIFYFSVSQITFVLAFGFFMQTKLYESYIGGAGGDHHHAPTHHHALDQALHYARPFLFFVVAFGGHTVWLIFLFFFSFCSVAYEKYWYQYLLKSFGEFLVMLLVCLLIMGIGHEHLVVPHAAAAIPIPSLNDGQVDYSKVAGLATCGFLTIDSLSIINLLKPGHHYALLEATTTLTLHLGLMGRIYFRIPAAVFVLVIVVIKNFLWRHIGHAQAAAPTNEHHDYPWVAPEVV